MFLRITAMKFLLLFCVIVFFVSPSFGTGSDEYLAVDAGVSEPGNRAVRQLFGGSGGPLGGLGGIASQLGGLGNNVGGLGGLGNFG